MLFRCLIASLPLKKAAKNPKYLRRERSGDTNTQKILTETSTEATLQTPHELPLSSPMVLLSKNRFPAFDLD